MPIRRHWSCETVRWAHSSFVLDGFLMGIHSIFGEMLIPFEHFFTPLSSRLPIGNCTTGQFPAAKSFFVVIKWGRNQSATAYFRFLAGNWRNLHLGRSTFPCSSLSLREIPSRVSMDSKLEGCHKERLFEVLHLYKMVSAGSLYVDKLCFRLFK